MDAEHSNLILFSQLWVVGVSEKQHPWESETTLFGLENSYRDGEQAGGAGGREAGGGQEQHMEQRTLFPLLSEGVSDRNGTVGGGEQLGCLPSS